MFEFDAGKLVIIGIVALIVIGPKELPRVLRQVGQAVAKLRGMAAEFQGQFMEAMREAELSDLREEAAKLAASAKIDAGFDPVAELKSELTRTIDATGTEAETDGTDLSPRTPEPAAVPAQNVLGPATGPTRSNEPPNPGDDGQLPDPGVVLARPEPVNRT